MAEVRLREDAAPAADVELQPPRASAALPWRRVNALQAGVFAAGAGVVGASISYWLLSTALLRGWMSESTGSDASGGNDAALPPVTILRPLKSGVPGLREKLEGLADALRPGDQMLLGVAPGSVEEAIGQEVRAAFPGLDISVIRCASGAALNPKISKLLQMTPHARHEHWVLMDSEVICSAGFPAALRWVWAHSGADVLTCAYRFANVRTWPQRLDAAGALLTFLPGLALVRRLGTVRWTLGACTALRRRDVEVAGGWKAFADDLAEDNRLGAALVRAGRKVQLSAHVATLESDPLDWRDYWRHQRRVAVTYRVSNSRGFAGLILTHGIRTGELLLAWSIVFHTEMVAPAASLLTAAVAVRWWTARRNAQELTVVIPRLLLVLGLASVVETACFLLAWTVPTVWWCEQKWRVTHCGKLRV